MKIIEQGESIEILYFIILYLLFLIWEKAVKMWKGDEDAWK